MCADRAFANASTVEPARALVVLITNETGFSRTRE